MIPSIASSHGVDRFLQSLAPTGQICHADPTWVDRRNWHTEWVVSTTCTVTSCSCEVALGMVVLHFTLLKQNPYSCFSSFLNEQGSKIPWPHPTFFFLTIFSFRLNHPSWVSFPLTWPISYLSSNLSSSGYIHVPSYPVYTGLTYIFFCKNFLLVYPPAFLSLHFSFLPRLSWSAVFLCLDNDCYDARYLAQHMRCLCSKIMIFCFVLFASLFYIHYPVQIW